MTSKVWMTHNPKCETSRNGEARPAQPGKSVQWTDLSDERRELGRAATAGCAE